MEKGIRMVLSSKEDGGDVEDEAAAGSKGTMVGITVQSLSVISGMVRCCSRARTAE